MKDEVDFKACTTLEEIIHVVDDYIDYYNNYRYQWNLKKMTPKQYRNHLLLASKPLFYYVLDKGSIL